MNLRGIISLVILIVSGLANLQAQYPYFKNYNINDGLVSNKIYNIMEDKSGFVWICTDLGVSRFDGISFVNFTTKDGLPDNEILGLFEDAKGRIWFNGYGTEPCYYYKGEIYNTQNDSFVKRIRKYKLPGLCTNVFIQWNNSIAYIVNEKGKIWLIGKDIEDVEIKMKGPLPGTQFQHILNKDKDTFIMYSGLETMKWRKGDSIFSKLPRFYPLKFNYSKPDPNFVYSFDDRTHIVEQYDLQRRKLLRLKIPEKYQNIFVHNRTVTMTGDSCYATYNNDFTKIIDQSDLSFNFARIFIDRKGNKWFGSFDNGIYFIRRNTPVNIQLPVGKRKGILSVVPEADRLYINTEKNGLMSVDTFDVLKEVFNIPHMERIMGLAQVGNEWIIGSDDGLYRMDKNTNHLKLIFYSAVKDIEQSGKNEILVSMASGAGIYQHNGKDSFIFIDNQRITAICRLSDNEIWLGGLNGLKRNIFQNNHYTSFDMKLDPVLDNSRIIDIKRDRNGNMWVATSQNGLFFCPLQGPVVRFNEGANQNHRIISDFCLDVVCARDNGIWLATAGGISVIYYWTGKKTSFSIGNYSIPEGMPGKIIKSIAFWRNKTFIATSNGLCYFNEFPAPRYETAEAVVTRIRANDSDYYTSSLVLPYHQNNLIISYAASFINSGFEYRFKYRIRELSEEWIQTNTLEVPLLGLEPGKYTFEIAAINSHGDAGKTTSFDFTILTPWFRQWWFIGLVSVLIIISVTYYYRLMKEKIELGKNLTLFRLRILRAQMNPHFVFNALSNIQHQIQIKNLKNAENYIGTLSSIMRKSIEYSAKEFIQLEKEINYTLNYLEIEKLRFEDKFDFEFSTDLDDAELSAIYVPPLILQPLVENAIKHAFKGIEYKGHINIDIRMMNTDTLRYVIQDNGCGFKPKETGSENHGLDITRERLSLLYKGFNKSGRLKIESGAELAEGGTKITIEIPIIRD